MPVTTPSPLTTGTLLVQTQCESTCIWALVNDCVVQMTQAFGTAIDVVMLYAHVLMLHCRDPRALQMGLKSSEIEPVVTR